MISDGKLEYKPYNPDSARGLLKGRVLPEGRSLEGGFDLCRKGGEYHCYVTELSDCDTETIENFKKRVKGNTFTSQNGIVSYKTACSELLVSYDGEFSVDGKPEKTVFDRYDSVFCKAKRKDKTIKINTASHSLELDFENAIRK